jgi:putative transposase
MGTRLALLVSMGRKPVIVCSKNPYHVTARTNNKDWFDIEMAYTYGIFYNTLKECKKRFNVDLHAFVLMNNHFHMLVSTPKANISSFLQYFMTQTSKAISAKSNRINKVYGGRNYKSLITSSQGYARCLKYIYLNPVRANICIKAEDYKWSTISNENIKMQQLCTQPKNGHDSLLPSSRVELIEWLNEGFSKQETDILRRASKRAEFEIKATGSYRKLKLPSLPSSPN